MVLRGVKAISLQIPIFQRYGCGYDGAGITQIGEDPLSPIPMPELAYAAVVDGDPPGVVINDMGGFA